MKVDIRPMREDDVPAVMEICRAAWRSFLNIPEKMVPSAENLRTRHLAAPELSMVAELDGAVVGSNFVADWGSLAVIGPVTVRPKGWTGNAGQLLLDGALRLAQERGFQHIAGYTFSNSPQHLMFFQRGAFWPRFLTLILARSVTARPGATSFERYSALSPEQRAARWSEAAELTGSLLKGMDLRWEMEKARLHRVGDTVFVREGERLTGMAVCQYGTGSDARTNTAYIRFGTVRHDPDAAKHFDRLLDACEALAVAENLKGLSLGMNSAHQEALTHLLERKFLPLEQGVALHWRNEPLYKESGRYAIDCWR